MMQSMMSAQVPYFFLLSNPICVRRGGESRSIKTPLVERFNDLKKPRTSMCVIQHRENANAVWRFQLQPSIFTASTFKIFIFFNLCHFSFSSRFTDSGKYQPYFGACFHLKEERSGDICNACVLLVKRFRKLPSGVSGHRHWGHVCINSQHSP